MLLKHLNTHTGFIHWLPGGGEEHRAVLFLAGLVPWRRDSTSRQLQGKT